MRIDDRLMDTAIDQFGRKGLEGASTRAIAAAAGTAMSSITYHYGGKEGLYLAAARHIADQVGERLTPALAASQARCDEDRSIVGATAAVVQILDRFVEMMVRPESERWARFVVREQMEPTAAFDVLYGGVMGRIIGHVAELIGRISGGRLSEEEARLKTIAIVGQALIFRVGRAALLRATGWADVEQPEAEAIRAVVRAHTRAILDSIAGEPTP